MSKSSRICVRGFIAIIVIVFVGAISNERYIGNAVHKDYPGMCYYNDTQTPIAIDTIYKPKTECVEIYCREDFVLHLRYCPRYMIGEGCTLNRDEEAEYPSCCPTIDCPQKS